MYKNTSAELVRAVRGFHRLTQRELAQHLGVSKRSVIRFEQRGAYFSTWANIRDPDKAGRWTALRAAYDTAREKAGLGADVVSAEELRRALADRRVTDSGSPDPAAIAAGGIQAKVSPRSRKVTGIGRPKPGARRLRGDRKRRRSRKTVTSRGARRRAPVRGDKSGSRRRAKRGRRR